MPIFINEVINFIFIKITLIKIEIIIVICFKIIYVDRNNSFVK